MMRVLITLVIVVLGTAASPAWAHKFRLFATVEGNQVHGQAYFSGGSHPQGIAVLLQDGQGQTLSQGETDQEGRFVLSLPAAAVGEGYSVHASVDGHQAQWALDGLPASGVVTTQNIGTAIEGQGPDQAALALIERAVARQIAPLRAQVDDLQNTIRFHDVLGGLGWLVGLAGLYSWWRARHRAG
jgi:nickel transport protein